MSGDPFDEGRPDPVFLGLFIGTVTDNEDPEALNRVRLRIPGVVEPTSTWAWPLGTLGGGSPQRGVKFTPAVGAELGVFFKQGDPDHPYYFTGHWGKPGGQSEIPADAKDLPKDEAPLVQALETERWKVTADDRKGKESLRLVDKLTGDFVEIDGVGGGIVIKGTSAVSIQSDGVINLDALQVIIQGRVVTPTKKPIE